MGVLKNGVGRPSNEVLRKRKILKIICVMLVLVIAGFICYILNNTGIIKVMNKENTLKTISKFSASERQMGDMNNDGCLTVLDVAFLYSYVRGNTTIIDSEAIKVADLSGNGEITVEDVAILYAKVRSLTANGSECKNNNSDNDTTDESKDDNENNNQTSSFSKDSWGTIIGNVRAENTDQYKVGDTKEIDLGELGKHTLRLVNKSNPAECKTDSKTFSQTACGFVVEFADIIELKKMNDSSYRRYTCYYTKIPEGDYESNRKYVCGEKNFEEIEYSENSLSDYINFYLYNAITEAEPMLKKGIMETKVSWDTETPPSSTNRGVIPETVNRYIYLLSLKEIYNVTLEETVHTDGVRSYPDVTSINETRQLDYYKNIGTNYIAKHNFYINGTYENVGNAIKKYNGTATKWWLRSMYCQGAFYFVKEDGNVETNNYSIFNSYVNGVSPAFRISE